MKNTAIIIRGDMHFHTTRSDGYQSSQQRLQQAIKDDLQLITITDHDAMTPKSFIRKAKEKNIISFPSTEISTRDYDREKSMHVTCYLQDYNAQLTSILDNTRAGKQSLITTQLQSLFDQGFEGNIEDFFEYFEKQGRPRGGLNKFDISIYIYGKESNKKRMHEIIGEQNISLDPLENIRVFYLLCLKEQGDLYEQYGVRIDEYEPDIESVTRALGNDKRILSIAHPNFSFEGEGIQYFEESIEYYLDKGINALEINSKATQQWIDLIYEMKQKYNLLLTLGSDNHNQGESDNKHEHFGVLNPFLSQDQKSEIFGEVIEYLD